MKAEKNEGENLYCKIVIYDSKKTYPGS